MSSYTLRVRGIAVRSRGFEFIFLHSPSGVMSGEREISELRSPLSPVLCSLVLPCSLPFAILRSSQKVALPASATGSGRACFPQRPPIPFGRRFKPKQVGYLFSRFKSIHSRPTSGLLLCTAVISLNIYF